MSAKFPWIQQTRTENPIHHSGKLIQVILNGCLIEKGPFFYKKTFFLISSNRAHGRQGGGEKGSSAKLMQYCNTQ